MHRLLNTIMFISAIFKGLRVGKTLKDAVSEVRRCPFDRFVIHALDRLRTRSSPSVRALTIYIYLPSFTRRTTPPSACCTHGWFARGSRLA